MSAFIVKLSVIVMCKYKCIYSALLQHHKKSKSKSRHEVHCGGLNISIKFQLCMFI